MTNVVPFEEDKDRKPGADDAGTGEFRLDLQGFEGPIDVLLQLSRDQKVDLTQISILALAEQYLEFVRAARRLNLELAADYLVMAAWLAYLKSKLLLPEPEGEEEPSGAEMAAALRFQLQRLEAMQAAGARLMALPRLGCDRFARGMPEGLRVVTSTRYEASLFDLLRAYGRNKSRVDVRSLHIAPLELYSVEQAVRRLRGLLGDSPGWRSLTSFLPPDLRDGLLQRSALASTFVASLELCREGKLRLRQDNPFGPIYLAGTQKDDTAS